MPVRTLTYQELLVARLIRGGGVPRVRITDIWVNSTASRDGGRSLWAIPKELADVEVNDTWLGEVHRSPRRSPAHAVPVHDLKAA